MAYNGTSLLVLLLAFWFSALTLARNLDIPESLDREDSAAQIAKKQRSISSSAHLRGVFMSSILNHETGHEENTLTHETGHAANNDKMMSMAALSREEEMSLPSRPHADNTPFSQDEEVFLPILSHSVDILVYESQVFLHDDDDTISSFLAQNGLPVGLVPSSVASYSITEDGKFTITLQKACYAKFDYEVYYAQTIAGKLSYGTITDLSGIQAKQAFIWVAITGVRTDVTSSDYIYFDSGPISKKLSISQFQTTPVCKVKGIASSALA